MTLLLGIPSDLLVHRVIELREDVSSDAPAAETNMCTYDTVLPIEVVPGVVFEDALLPFEKSRSLAPEDCLRRRALLTMEGDRGRAEFDFVPSDFVNGATVGTGDRRGSLAEHLGGGGHGVLGSTVGGVLDGTIMSSGNGHVRKRPASGPDGMDVSLSTFIWTELC